MTAERALEKIEDVLREFSQKEAVPGITGDALVEITQLVAHYRKEHND